MYHRILLYKAKHTYQLEKKIGCFWKNAYEEINTKLIFCCLLLTAQQQDEFSAHLEGYLGCLE